MGRKKKDITETKPPDKVKTLNKQFRKRTDVAERKQKALIIGVLRRREMCKGVRGHDDLFTSVCFSADD